MKNCPNCGAPIDLEKMTIYGYTLRSLAVYASLLNESGITPEEMREAVKNTDFIFHIVQKSFDDAIKRAIINISPESLN